MHRLVFSRRLGMLVAVAEHARCSGKSAGGEKSAAAAPFTWALSTALLVATTGSGAQTRPPVVFASRLPAASAALPVPYGTTLLTNGNRVNPTPRPFAYDPAKGSTSADLSAAGRVSWSTDGTAAIFNQGSVERVVVNWDSFNIGAGNKVHFTQDKDPSKYVSALNRIWSADPTQIFGALTADREVVLLNANGVYFGRGARVDTGKFVATSLSIADSVFDKGLRNAIDGSAVFGIAGTDYSPTHLDSAVSVEAGAEIRSAAGGDVLLIAPRVVNQGRIQTPGGQAVLAAGGRVYLTSSADPRQRGLIVAVDPIRLADGSTNDAELGIVENAASGSYKTINGATVANSTPDSTAGLVARLNEIRAESGTVNLVGLTVRQNGAINATTAVKGANGAIYLQAMASTATLLGGGENDPDRPSTPAGRRGLKVETGALARVGAALGAVQFGSGSVTAVRPDGRASTQIDAETFNPSRIRVEGAAIHVASQATIEAPSGRVELLAAQSSLNSPLFDGSLNAIPGSDSGSRIVIAPDARISVAGLRDVPVDGLRNQGAQRLFSIELADAPVQRDGPLYRKEVFFDLRDGGKITAANVTGAAAAVRRTAEELSTTGGVLRVEAEGAVVVGDGAQLDVSGGTVQVSQATIQNTLVQVGGRAVTFKSANAGVTIDSVLGTTQKTVAPAYTDGKNGGALSISGRQVAIQGELKGGVVQGDRQLDGRDTRAAPSSLALGRQVAGSFYLPGVRMGAAAAAPIDASLFADPLAASTASLAGVANLSLPALVEGGFRSLALRAGSVSQDTGSELRLGVQGKLDVRADTIDLGGRVLAPGGSITLATVNAEPDALTSSVGDILLSGDVLLDTAGLWTNDTNASGNREAASIQRTGGQIDIRAARSLSIGAGAQLDVSAGASLSGSGVVTRGSAGAITLNTGRSERFESTLSISGVRLSGLDFAGGGSLFIGAPQLTVTSGTSDGFSLSPDFFSAGGFGTIAVTTFGDIHVTGGTTLHPALRNWQLAPGYRQAASGPMSALVAMAQSVDEQLAERLPVNLTLAAARPLNPSLGLTGSSLIVDSGADIQLQAAGKLTLNATRNLKIGDTDNVAPGTTAVLSAPGGAIALSVLGTRGVASPTDTSADTAGFLNDQVLWIGADARISAAGTAKLRPEVGPVYFFGTGAGVAVTGDRVTGTVLGGGSITLEAQRGYVVTQANSLLSVDGASAALNFAGMPQAVQVAKAAGTVKVSSPEGFVLDGTITAKAPMSGGTALADGGRLDLSVGVGGVYTVTAGTPYSGFDIFGNPVAEEPFKPRQLVVGDYAGLVRERGVAYGADLTPGIDNGIGYVPTSLLRDAGFDALRLGAGDKLQFDTSLSITKPLKIALDAPAIAGRNGVDVTLQSSSINLGDASASRIGRPADTTATTTADAATLLTLQARTIDVVGNSGLQGFSRVHLDAGATRDGEVRLSALTQTNLLAPDAPRWTLNFAGNLDITAGQVYAATGALFTLQGAQANDAIDPGSTLTLKKGPLGTAGSQPLSVFGSLTANATTIVHGGVLRQPFGSIALQAERSLTLASGSETSVTGDGATRIFGETTNLTQWLAGNDYATRLPFDKRIRLQAETLVTDSEARVRASGGGDILAWEFFPGVGGTRDYYETSGLFAILPDHHKTLASAFGGGPLAAAAQGKEIVITLPDANSGPAGQVLPPGTYSLLPARYALLGKSLPQGAFLVRRATDQGKTVLTARLQQDDGSVVVTGYVRDAGSVNVGAPGERFVVEPMATVAAKAEVRLTSVSDLLATQATILGTAITPLPRDAGQVQVSVLGQEKTQWQANVDLHAAGGLAGVLDMSATRLALVDVVSKTPDGALGITADVISQSGAGSVLLGGLRSLATGNAASSGPTWYIDPSATEAVTVDIGARTLQVEELLMAATNSVSIADGTHVSAAARGTLGARTLATVGDGVLAAVSANPLEIVRTGVQLSAGQLLIGANSALGGKQVALDATGVVRIDSSVSLPADALALGAKRIVIGEGATPDPTATVLTGDLLATVRTAQDLNLRSYESIDFVGVQNWAQRPAATLAQTHPMPTVIASRLVLDAPLVRGLDTTDGTTARTDIAANAVVLRNTTGGAASGTLAGEGSLTLQVIPPVQYGTTGGLTLGPGALALAFDDVALRSHGDILLQGQGASTAQGNLTLSAARLTATSGAQQAVTATNALRVTTESGSRTLGEPVGQGADIQLAGATVVQDGLVDLPGGNLAIRASSTNAESVAISFGEKSTTRVAGFELSSAEGNNAFGHAGKLSAIAASGRIEVLGTLDARAARRADGSIGDGDGGRISLSAAGAGGQLVLSRVQTDGSTVAGRLLANAGGAADDVGGRLKVDVNTMASADALATAAGAGGFTSEFDLRARAGAVTLDSGVTAQRIVISADTGTLTLGSTDATHLDASSASGGVVQLAAGADLLLGDKMGIDARSLRAGANGGDVLLSSTAGRVRLAPSAQVNASGDDAKDGRIVLRAQRGATNTSVNIDALDTSRLLAGEVDIEAVRTYRTVTVGSTTRNIATIATGNSAVAGSGSTSTGTLGQTTVRTDSATFMNAKASVLSALRVSEADSDRVHLRAGVEVLASGNLTVSNDWQLTADRPGNDAGFLTLRATGNLLVNGTINDGFSTAVQATGVLNDSPRSWSYRVAAGADTAAANPMTVVNLASATQDTGNLHVAAGRMVRTGAGSIEMAAGRDMRFVAGSGNTAAGMAYVAGRKMDGAATVLADLFSRQTAKPQFTEQGGRLELSAGRDITAPEATQLINNWLWRSGQLSTRPGEEDIYSVNSQLAWWSEFSRFRQTAGSFGGGNLNLRAGRDIVNVQAMVPTAAWADNTAHSQAALQVRNGGDLTVSAGRDVLGGQFFVGRGDGRIDSGGSIAEAAANARIMAPALALMDGQWFLAARDKIVTTGALNPTAAPVSGTDNRTPVSSFFYTWGDDASLNLNANAGSIGILGIASSQVQNYGVTAGATATDIYARVMPATLRATAATSDIALFPSFGGGGLMFPSASGQLDLWAGANITLGGVGVVALAMADSDLSLWPDPFRPLTVAQASTQLAGTSGLIGATQAGLVAGAALRANDSEPVRIHALGSVDTSGLSTLLLGKQARVSAGQDVRSLRLSGQNLNDGDYTTINAGRNFLAGLTGMVEIGGPGELEIAAGNEVDLGSSAGITTFGNQRNAKLPMHGASIKVTAAASGVVDLSAFAATYLLPASAGGNQRAQQYREQLTAHVRLALGQPTLGFDQAWDYFKGFPAAAQTAFSRQVLAAEFGANYLAGATPGAAAVAASLQAAFDRHKAYILQAGQTTLAANGSLTLPGRDVLSGAELATYLNELRAVNFSDINLDSILPQRVANLAQVAEGWRNLVAADLGSTAAGLEAAAAQNAADPVVVAYRAALQDFSGRRFESYRDTALASEVASAGTAAAQFGRKSLPMRLAFYDAAFRAAELGGLGSFAPLPVWDGQAAVVNYAGTLAMTQSSVITERGGDISLRNAGGAINVGLKENSAGGTSTPKGVITLGGGDIFGFAKNDFQVNTQRVFVVGQGDMNIWSSKGDIDSGRGANTAVAAPPLTARRSVDGVVFEVAATTTGSGLGILEDAAGLRSGTIGLYPAFGEILALDAFIRAPSVVLGASIQGADNLQAAAVGGAAAPVSAPVLAAAAPPSSTTAENRATDAQASNSRQSEESRTRNSLLTVDLLGLGPALPDELCSDEDAKAGKCTKTVQQ